MNKFTEYFYSFANASITLRVIDYLRDRPNLPIDSVAVINTIDCWLVKVKMKNSLSLEKAKDIQAFFMEMGIPYQPSGKIKMAFLRLEAGESPVDVMNYCQVVIVAYGQPDKEEIEIFREQIVDRLGYCPQNMA